MLQIDTAISTNMGGIRAGDKERQVFLFFSTKNIPNTQLFPKYPTKSPELTKSYRQSISGVLNELK